MPNYNNFKINSNFKTDLIVFSYSGTINLDIYGYGTLSVNHGLSFTPLPFGLYSTDGGTTWNDIDFQTQEGFGQMFATPSTIEITINIYNNPPASVLIRIFGFAPSTVPNVIVNPPTPLSKFYLDSRKTYELLIASGRTVINNSSSLQTIYTHNLGYLPRIMLWEELPDNSISRHCTNARVEYSGYYSYIYSSLSTTKLEYMNYDTLSPIQRIIHWRLYGGQA